METYQDYAARASARRPGRTLPPPKRPSRWLAHLNVLLPAAVAVFYGAMPMVLWLPDAAWPVYLVGSFAVPAWLCWKGVLLPAHVARERRVLYRIGHALVALANVVVGALVGGPLFYAWWSGNQDYAFYALFGMFAMVFAVPACVAGFVCVQASRGRPEPESDE